jgi:hypothetical protein
MQPGRKAIRADIGQGGKAQAVNPSGVSGARSWIVGRRAHCGKEIGPRISHHLPGRSLAQPGFRMTEKLPALLARQDPGT